MKLRDLVAEFIADCEYRMLRPATIANYRWATAMLVSQYSELPARGRDLLPLLSQPTLGLESRRALLRILNRLLSWAVRNAMLAANPLAELDPLPRSIALPRVLDEPEIAQLFASCGTRRDAALVSTILDTGLRLGELAALRWTDVHARHVRVSGKRGQRRVPVSQKGLGYLVGLGDDEAIWTGRSGPLSREGVRQIFRRLFSRARIPGPKAGPHTLRHTFATLYVRGGGNLRVLQEILGHTRLETTMIYVHLAGSHVDEDHAEFSPLIRYDLGANIKS